MAHSLKGVASTIGATELRETAVEIEVTLKQGLIPSDADIQKLSKHLGKTIESAKYWLAVH